MTGIQVVRHGRPDAGHVVALMTCRGREDLRRRTEASLRLGGWDRWAGPKLVVEDGIDHGQAQTFFAVLKAAAACPGFTALTLFEDDVVVAKNMLDYVSTFELTEGFTLASWFCRRASHVICEPPHLELGSAHEFAYNQATTMPASTVIKLLASEQLRRWPSKHGADTLIGMAMPNATVAYHFPNLADHTGGGRSLVGSFGPQRSSTFVGEGFDACGLRRA